MRKNFSKQDVNGVFAVPPLARHKDTHRTIDPSANDRVVSYLAGGGITRLMYAGNAFVYHLTLREYEQMLDWLSGLSGNLLCIPGAGPAYGRAMDQAPLLRKYGFPLAMMLPCGDPRDAAGLELGMREFAQAAGMPLIAYVKDELNFGADRDAGLDAIARLVDSGVCVAIKYAVVRKDPAKDDYLAGLLHRIGPEKVISGIGERPAIIHLRQFGWPGFTTGSGCLAPASTNKLFQACIQKNYDEAEKIRAAFMPLEDLRDQWSPAKVLHAAVELAGIATTGPIPPYVSPLDRSQTEALRPVAQALARRH